MTTTTKTTAAAALCSLLLLAWASAGARGQGTWRGFYSASCPRAEAIVRSTIQNHYRADASVAAGILRMHFHDCFVRGCDASILISGPSAERNALPNLALRGYDVIEDAKAQLEAACPGVVSCADVLALAARDSVVLAGGPSWAVPTGRRDGLVSSATDANDLPSFSDSIEAQKQKFSQKGLTTRDLVTLVGAHTIGTAQCQFFRYRLYNFTSAGGPDPTIDPGFVGRMRALCPADGDGSKRVALDYGSGITFDTDIYDNVRDGRAMLESDQRLMDDAGTRRYIDAYTGLIGGLLGAFDSEFAQSMVRMSNVGVLTGDQGEVRRVCSSFNSPA